MLEDMILIWLIVDYVMDIGIYVYFYVLLQNNYVIEMSSIAYFT